MRVLITLVMAGLLLQTSDAERRVVDYLKANVKAGQPVIVSQLYNNVFPAPQDRKVLDRLFNTFFKIPMFLVQYNASSKRVPTLKEISEQFSLPVAGEADVLLRIMESDPRIPKFIERSPRTGEITRIDIARIQGSPQFGHLLERTIAGWEGKPAPFFSLATLDGRTINSQQYAGKPHLLYFWFTNCPPCMRTSPLLVELYNAYASKGFTIIAANADKLLELPYDDATRAEYIKKTGIKFTTATLDPETQRAYGGVSVFPTLFFVDKRGTVVKQFVNFQEKASLDAAIQEALK